MKGDDFDQGFLAEALPAFISEAREQIERIEQLLLELEDRPGERELLDELFRCAHTVKGSAGIFGLDRVVGFTHHVETLLDRLREGEIALSAELGTLLLECNDEIRKLVDAGLGHDDDSAETLAAREALVERLRAAGDAPAAAPAASTADADPAPAAVENHWQISAHFGAETFRNGMDPLAVLYYLQGLGTLHDMGCARAAVPPLDALDPERCHLGFDFGLDTTARREEVESAFSFVREDCELSIVPPPPPTTQLLAARIDALPDQMRLGDILVGVGAISPAQLNQSLVSQAQTANRDGSAPPLGEILQSRAGVNPKLVNAALDKQRQQREAPAGNEDQRFIRVQADRLDAVINLLGELVIASAGASLAARQTRNSPLIEANQQIGRLVEEIRNGTLQLRMVPIGETFARFRRVVRDTAAELGKEVVLEIIGGETELDKSVVERIADPLMHLVRNALDHGLETPEQRLAAGKPAQARLTLQACHESGTIQISIVDDGRGIQRERVLQRAWDRGLVERGTVPPDEQILRLIFEPGFSTAEKVTNLSGRGVGMDVVRRNIEALRGSVNVESEEGVGSRIDIRLPLTLAIIDGFLVGVAGSRFIFPLEAVVEVIEGRQCSFAPGQASGTLEMRGRMMPVVSLRRLYGLDAPPPERSSVVVLRSGARRFGVQVDQLLGQHQTVIKPLGRLLGSLRGISGSSILGSGEVALIFDVHALNQLAAAPPPSAKNLALQDRQRDGTAPATTTEGLAT